MKRTVQITADGSQTIAIDEMNVTYHSKHGAVQESMHVFINAGLGYVLEKFHGQEINIFEMGFGTGLNALLSLDVALKTQRKIYYYAVEKFPLDKDEWKQLEYGELLNLEKELKLLHSCSWQNDVQVNEQFILHKSRTDLAEVQPQKQFHLIYFDAFAPSVQPELWTEAIFSKMYSLLVEGGFLVTYCSKGDVRRAMLAAGFKVEKLHGPPGKREMLRAVKPSKAE